MAGFGSDPFGVGPFGTSDDMTDIFWNSLILPVRQADAENGDVLRKWLDTVGELFSIEFYKMEDVEHLRDARRMRTQYDQVYTLRLGSVATSAGSILDMGSDGAVLTAGTFTAPSAYFDGSSIGKEIEVSGSKTSARNNTTLRILGRVDATTVVVSPVTEVDAGPLKWVYRGSASTSLGTATYYVEQGDLSAIAQGFILSDGNSDNVVVTRTQFRTGTPLPEVERFGTDLVIGSSNTVFVPRAVFSRRDVDKPFTISNAQNEDNEGVYRVLRVVDASTVVLTGMSGEAIALVPETATSADWAIRCLPLIEILTPVRLDGTVLQGEVDGSTTAPATFSSASADFTTEDVGRTLRIANSGVDDDGFYEILTVVDANTVTVDATLTGGETSLVWSVRTPSKQSDTTAVEVRAPSVLAQHARDYGLTVDVLESELRQRSWVHNVNQWLDKKGTVEAYEIVARASGFEANVQKLYRIANGLRATLPAANVYAVGDARPGRLGGDGSLVAPNVFSSPTGIFEGADLGRSIIISGSTGQDDTYEIVEVLSETSFRLGGATILTDPANGSITWNVVRLYTDLPPLQPYFDEVNSDLLAHVVTLVTAGASSYRVDKYCWQADFSSEVPVTISVATQISTNRYRLTIADAVSGLANSPEVVLGLGKWTITDSAGATYYLESLPQGGPPLYTVEVTSATAPATGLGSLEYECSEVIRCGYCPASAVRIELTLGDLATGTARELERAQERVLRRLRNEVKPAHVRIIPVFKTTFEATLGITAEIEVGGIAGATLIAPLTAYYDEIPADVIVTDIALTASIETP